MEDIWDKASCLFWDEKKFALRHFLEVFDLPQAVKITHSTSGKKEAREMKPFHEDDVLILHKMVSATKVMVANAKNKYYIPLECPMKVDVKPANLKDYYDGVQELSKICPNFARVIAGYLGMENEESLSPGQKILLKEVDNKNKTLKYMDLDNGKLFTCPFFWNAQFIPLVDDKDYTLKEAIRTFSIPFNIEFIESSAGERRDTRVAALLIKLRSLSVRDIYTDTCVIASSKIGKERYVYAIPQHANLSVQAAKGAVKNNSPTYDNLCASFNQAIKYQEILYSFDYDIKTHSVKQLSLTEKMLGEINGYNLTLDPEIAQRDSYSGMYESIKEYQTSERDKTQNYQSLLTVERQYQSPCNPDLGEVTSPERLSSTRSRKVSDTLPPVPATTNTTPPPSIPEDLSSLTVDQICSCLEACGMAKCARIFKNEYIDGEMFMSLTEETLKDLQIRPMQRHKVVKIINGWRPKVEPSEKENIETKEESSGL